MKSGSGKNMRVLLPAIILLGAVVANVWTWPEIRQNYHPLKPHYGSALSDFNLSFKKGTDRSWYAYAHIKKYYPGWRFLSFSQEVAWASKMYDFNYGGIQKPHILNYDPELTATEADNLLTNSHVTADLGRLGGKVIIIKPGLNAADKTVVLLRHKSLHFFAPKAVVPDRYSGL